MSTTRRIAMATKLALVCLLAAAALAQASNFRSDPDETTASARKPAAFHVRGHLKGIYPGLKTTLKVRVTNAGPTRITLTGLKTSVRSLVTGCPSSSLKVAPFKGHRAIKGHGSIKLKLKARMKATAPDACQGARYRLTYSGKAA